MEDGGVVFFSQHEMASVPTCMRAKLRHPIIKIINLVTLFPSLSFSIEMNHLRGGDTTRLVEKGCLCGEDTLAIH